MPRRSPLCARGCTGNAHALRWTKQPATASIAQESAKKRGSTLRTRPSRGHGQPGATAASWQSPAVGLPLVPLPLQPSLPSSPGERTHSAGTWVVAHSPGAVTVPYRPRQPPSLCIDGFFSKDAELSPLVPRMLPCLATFSFSRFLFW